MSEDRSGAEARSDRQAREDRSGAEARSDRVGPGGLGELLHRTADLAVHHLEGVGDGPVLGAGSASLLREALGGPLPTAGAAPLAVLEALEAAAAPGIVASAGPRYFGFVTGGSLPAALAADWLAAAWDQNAALAVMSPAAAVAEEVVGGWLADLLGLPATASFGVVTGAQMANVVGLAAARHHTLAELGVDVAEVGLAGAPPLRVVVGAERHTTVDVALRYLGIGRRQMTVVDADDEGRMRADALVRALAALGPGPTIVCAQAGCVNSGAVDPLDAICDAAAGRAWVHIDGAFGLWAAAAPARARLVSGVSRADSWATDGHKWLNVPYDCGLVFCAHPDSHRAAMAMEASYLVRTGDDLRNGTDWAPESSRRARAFALWAALRQLGRSGVADLVERCCAHAARLADALAAEPGVEVLADVVLNQVLVRFAADDCIHQAVLAGVQSEGATWFGSTVWQGRPAARISVSGWSTTRADIDRTLEAIRTQRARHAG